MPIHFDPSRMTISSSNIPTDPSLSLPNHPVEVNFKSDLRSLAGDDHELRFCAWLGKKLDELCAWISRLFSSTRNEAHTEIDERGRLNRRIEQGKGIITTHFTELVDRVDEGDSHRTAVIVVLKYNNQTAVHFGKVSEGRGQLKEGTINRLCELLNNNRSCESSKLSIETLIFKKNGTNNFDYCSNDSWIEFSNQRGSGSGNGSADQLNRIQVYNLLQISTSSDDSQLPIRLADFVLNQL